MVLNDVVNNPVRQKFSSLEPRSSGEVLCALFFLHIMFSELYWNSGCLVHFITNIIEWPPDQRLANYIFLVRKKKNNKKQVYVKKKKNKERVK